MAADSNYNYWDSCIFIDGLKKTPGRFPQISQLEQQAKGGHLFIFTSTMAIAEVVELRPVHELMQPVVLVDRLVGRVERVSFHVPQDRPRQLVGPDQVRPGRGDALA